MKKYNIAVIAGDGTGPEVMREGVKVLKAASSNNGFRLEFHDYDFGGARYLKTGETLPDSAVAELRTFDAIYLGAIGHPDVKPGILEKGILLRMRFELDLYINLRPVKLYPGVKTPLADKGPKEIDFVVVRENTEGLYCGAGGFHKKGTADEVAVQESINTRKGVERCIRYAFDVARKRKKAKELPAMDGAVPRHSSRRREDPTATPFVVPGAERRGPRREAKEGGVTLCGKTNVLTFAFDLWERAFYDVAKEYPDIKPDYAHVDATCMWMVKNPEWFDVIVTDNMFGDIITDLGAMIQGGMGIAAGGNIHPGGASMFEPIGGSAPKYTGKNVINPLACICAGQMLLDFLGESKAAQNVEIAVVKALRDDLKDLSAGKMGLTTEQVGDRIADYVAKGATL